MRLILNLIFKDFFCFKRAVPLYAENIRQLPGLVGSVSVKLSQLFHGGRLTEVRMIADGAWLFDVSLLHVYDGAWELTVEEITQGEIVGPVFVLQEKIWRWM